MRLVRLVCKRSYIFLHFGGEWARGLLVQNELCCRGTGFTEQSCEGIGLIELSCWDTGSTERASELLRKTDIHILSVNAVQKSLNLLMIRFNLDNPRFCSIFLDLHFFNSIKSFTHTQTSTYAHAKTSTLTKVPKTTIMIIVEQLGNGKSFQMV